MKKNIYVKPEANIIEIETTEVLASSPGVETYDEQGDQQFLGRERGSFWN